MSQSHSNVDSVANEGDGDGPNGSSRDHSTSYTSLDSTHVTSSQLAVVQKAMSMHKQATLLQLMSIEKDIDELTYETSLQLNSQGEMNNKIAIPSVKRQVYPYCQLCSESRSNVNDMNTADTDNNTTVNTNTIRIGSNSKNNSHSNNHTMNDHTMNDELNSSTEHNNTKRNVSDQGHQQQRSRKGDTTYIDRDSMEDRNTPTPNSRSQVKYTAVERETSGLLNRRITNNNFGYTDPKRESSTQKLTLDERAKQLPDQYPNGNHRFQIPKYESDIVQIINGLEGVRASLGHSWNGVQRFTNLRKCLSENILQYYDQYVREKYPNDEDKTDDNYEELTHELIKTFNSTTNALSKSKRNVGPLISWASKSVNNRSGKKSCLGIYSCSVKGCIFREKPRVPRHGGKDKYSTRGALPESKAQFCKVHPTSELIHIGCECYWFVRDKETHWEVEHHGTHRHLVPPPTQAHPNSLKILEAHMRTAPELIPVQLSTGRQTRLPMRDVDPVFINQDYLSHRMKQIRRRINKDLTGSETAPQSLDAAFQFFSKEKDFSETIYSSSFAGKNVEPHIVFMTEEMQEACQTTSESRPGWQTDAVEGFAESEFYQGQINVTMTSCWCDLTDSMFPIFISILFSKDKEAFKTHWEKGVGCWAEKHKLASVNDFKNQFPGNTSDFSQSILGGWVMAVNDILENKVGDKLTDGDIETLWRFCTVHFKRGVTRLAQIADIIPPEMKHDWYTRCMGLLAIHSFDKFMHAIHSLDRRYPNAKNFLRWYLGDQKASILFPACKDLSAADMARFQKLSDNTNGQEGMGGLLQQVAGRKKLCLQEMCRHINFMVRKYSDEYRLAKQCKIRYRRATKQDKKKGAEPKSEYKAPDDRKSNAVYVPMMSKLETEINDEVKHPVYEMSNDGDYNQSTDTGNNFLPSATTNNHPPLQLGPNQMSCCYATSLVQNVMSSKVLMDAILELQPCPCKDADSCQHPFTHFRKVISEIKYNNELRPNLGAMSPELVLAAMKVCSDRKQSINYGGYNDPLEFMQSILDTKKEDDPDCESFSVYSSVLTMGKVVVERFCALCGKCETLQSWEDDDDIYSITVNHDVPNSKGLQACIHNKLKIQYVEPPNANSDDTNTTNRCSKCKNFSLLEKKWIKLDEVQATGSNKEMVLPICVQPAYSTTEVSNVRKEQWHENEDGAVDLTMHESAPTAKDNIIRRKHIPLETNQLIDAELQIDLTPYVYQYHKFAGKQVIGELTGYISLGNQHFVSVTKSSKDENFYLSDDKDHWNPRNLGHALDARTWPKPFISFYTIRVIDDRMENMQYSIPFYPKLTPNDIAEAASSVLHISQDSSDLRRDPLIKIYKDVKDPNVVNGSSEEYCSAPLYLRDTTRNNLLDLKTPGVEGNYGILYNDDGNANAKDDDDGDDDKAAKALRPVKFSSFCKLKPDTFVDDAVVNYFGSLLNKSELDKRKKDPSYKPYHMMDVYFISKLCGTDKKTYSPLQGDERSRARRFVRKFGRVQAKWKKCGLDIFQCSRIIIPVNEGPNLHWTFYCVDPATLLQEFYCSTHNRRDDTRLMRSKFIFQWIKHQHQMCHGEPHPLDKTSWSISILEDRPDVLKNSRQASVDCALHMCCVPMLKANGKDVSVFGNTDKERELAGIEMRYRMILSILHNENWFQTEPEKERENPTCETTHKINQPGDKSKCTESTLDDSPAKSAIRTGLKGLRKRLTPPPQDTKSKRKKRRTKND